MKPKNIKIRKHSKNQYKTTSVTIRLEQYYFLKTHNINFSSLVQSALKDLMEGTNE